MTAPTATSAAKREEQAIQALRDVLRRIQVTAKVDLEEVRAIPARNLAFVQSIFPYATKEHMPESQSGITAAMMQGDCSRTCAGRRNCPHNGCTRVLTWETRLDGRRVVGVSSVLCGIAPMQKEDDDGDKSYFRDKRGGQNR